MKKVMLVFIFAVLSSCLVSCTSQGNDNETKDYDNNDNIVDLPSGGEEDNLTDVPEVFSLEGKKMVFLGSSVTYGSASGGWSMCEYFEEYHNCEVIKLAVPGTTLVYNNEDSYVARLVNEIFKIEDCDIFICQLSTNDATQNKPLGAISDSYDIKDFNIEEIIGAMEYIIALVQDVLDCPVFFYTGTQFASSNYQEMINALYQLKTKWHVGIIDLWNDEEMNTTPTEKIREFMADGIHPTRKGYEFWWGPKFEEYILKFFNN